MRRTTAGLVTLLAGRAVWQAVLAQRGLVAASGDDFLRTLIAWDWAQSPFFMAWRYAELSWAWLPLPFWMTGSLLRLWMRPDLVPRLLSLVLSLLSLVLLWRLWVRLWNRSVAMQAVVIVATIPWHMWLAGAATAQPLFQCIVTAALLLATSERPLGTVGAGAAFGLGTAVRPEGWILAVLWVAWLAFGARPRGTFHRAVSGVAACAFPAVWGALWWREAGDPFLLVDAGARYQELALGGAPSLLLRALQFPFVLFVTSPLLVAVSVVAVARLRSSLFARGTRAYSWLSLGFVAAMFLASALGMGTTSAPQRYALLPLVLLVPFGVQVVRPGARRWAVVGLIAALGVWASWHVPRRYTLLWKVGCEIGNLQDAGALPSETLLCGQEAWDDVMGASEGGRSPVPACEEWGLAVASRRPVSVVCSRRGGFLDARGEPSCRGVAFRDVPTALTERAVLLVTRDEGPMEGAPSDFELLALRGPYRIWGPAELGSCFFPEWDRSAGKRVVGHLFTEGLSLEAVGWESRFLPPRVYLHWRLDRPTAWTLRPHLVLEDAEGRVTRHFLPRLQDAWPPGWRATDPVTVAEVRVPEGKPAGVYHVGVGMSGSEVSLGSVVLGSSKREVLLALARGEASGWATLLRTLLQL